MDSQRHNYFLEKRVYDVFCTFAMSLFRAKHTKMENGTGFIFYIVNRSEIVP